MNYENYDLCFPDQPVVDLYLPTWANLPAFRHKPAFIWADDSKNSSTFLTYEQLNTSVQSISSNLSSLPSLKRGDTVLILCAPGLELVEMIFSCQRAGLVAVPLSPPHPSFANGNHHHLVRALSQTKPKVALATCGYINRVKEYISASQNSRLADLLERLTWISTEELKIVNRKQNLSGYNGCKANEVYLIQYTSGATEVPKPVLVTAGAAAHNVRVARKAYDLHPNSVITSWLPQYHDCGLMFLLLTIVSGATCVLASPSAFINRPRLWLELISDYKASCTPVPSFTLPLVIKRGGVHKGDSSINFGSMKNLIIINEPIYNSSIQEFVKVFRPYGLNPNSIAPSYGLAENCTFVSTSWTSGRECDFPIHKKLLPSAKLSLEDEVEILVVNEETRELVEDGVEGEIWISSPSNAIGYLDHPSLSHEIFHGRLRNKVGGCYVRTSDRGIVLGKERYLFITGRCSDILKLESGMEVHPHFIETTAYNSYPKLLRGGCLAALEISKEIVIVAELQTSGVEGESLKKACVGIRNAILNEKGVQVGRVVLVKGGVVPKTSSGKVQRWAAKLKFERGEMDIVMKMEFQENGLGMVEFNTTFHQNRGKKGIQESKKVQIAQEIQGISARNHVSLLSSL